MKKILMAAVAVSALSATPAMAQTGPSQTYTFDGTVAARCVITGASLVSFGALTDESGAYTSGASEDSVDSEAYCNQASTTATIKHTNLTTDSAASLGFTNVIPMSAALSTPQGASVVDETVASGTDESAGTTDEVNAFTGLKVTATLGSIGSAKLVAGTYEGSITVTLTPTT
jgi:hypothetical protein